MTSRRQWIPKDVNLWARNNSLMEIEISAAESLGVRGLSCLVKTEGGRILIDPGMALGYQREGLLPHPLQVAAGEEARQGILEQVSQATGVVISHFHGDHVPLAAANPYQMSLESAAALISKGIPLWINEVPVRKTRAAERCRDLCDAAGYTIPCGNNRNHGCISLSRPVPHGFPESFMGTVMMTRIKDGHEVFVHASDIQLLADEPVSLILDWEPSILLVSGPPIYRDLSINEKAAAWKRARLLSENIKVCIIDHHLLRCEAGAEWLDDLNRSAEGDIICAADFMGQPRRLLEARRAELYHLYPVPEGWHEQYALGTADTSAFRRLDGVEGRESFCPLTGPAC